jgi:entericidin B
MLKPREGVSRIGHSQGRTAFERRVAGIRTSGTLSWLQRPAYPDQTQGELLMTRLIVLLLIAGTAALAGCNTMAGAGQDISKGGNAITNSADKHGAE